LGLNQKLTPKILTSKSRHENDDIFKNALSKKGLEYFKLSNGTNKSIANFRETIPLNEHLRSCESKYKQVVAPESANTAILLAGKKQRAEHLVRLSL
jgi:hypothetical protein